MKELGRENCFDFLTQWPAAPKKKVLKQITTFLVDTMTKRERLWARKLFDFVEQWPAPPKSFKKTQVTCLEKNTKNAKQK